MSFMNMNRTELCLEAGRRGNLSSSYTSTYCRLLIFIKLKYILHKLSANLSNNYVTLYLIAFHCNGSFEEQISMHNGFVMVSQRLGGELGFVIVKIVYGLRVLVERNLPPVWHYDLGGITYITYTNGTNYVLLHASFSYKA